MDINNYASKGVAGTGLGLGIAGTSLGVLNSLGGLGSMAGLLGGRSANTAIDAATLGAILGRQNPHCSEDHCVNRYELGLQQENASLKADIALRDANTYNDQKMLEMYKYVDGRFREFETQLGNQAVKNQATQDSFQVVNERICCVQRELDGKICAESKARRCADNSLVTYMNATFYPKMVADVTTGTTTTAQTLYNPLPIDNCDCGC